jgi:arsenite transporter
LARETLEKYQVVVYLAAIACGLVVGAFLQTAARPLELIVWPLLGSLLFTTFLQVPFGRLGDAFREPKFLGVAVLGNFLVVPVLVWALVKLLPDVPAIHLGVLLVLLVPCTDWFISFSHLGKGDTNRAIAFAPISLLLQIALLPFYLWLFIGGW